MLSAWLVAPAIAAEDGEQTDGALITENQPGDENDLARKPGKRGSRGQRADRERHGPRSPEELFDHFDENEDGQLSREEFKALTKAVHQHHARHGHGEGHRGRSRDEDRPGPDFRPLQNPGDRPGPPPEGRRGRRGDAQGRQQGSREGGRRMPDPNEVFDHFDANGDGQLSRKEFRKLAEKMRERREQYGRRGQGSDDRRGPPRQGGR